MVWFLVDDVLPFHERVLRAGNAAMGLWVRGGAWCSGQLTDGFIPADVARQMGKPAEIRKLVDVGLWSPAVHEEQDGFRFHAWAQDGTGQKRQPTKVEVEEKRRKEREKKQRDRARQAHAADGRFAPVSPGVSPGDTPGESLGESHRSIPGQTIPPLLASLEGGVPPVDNPGDESEPPTRCERHLHDDRPPRCGPCKDARLAHEAWAARQPAPGPAPFVPKPGGWNPAVHCQHGEALGVPCDACEYEARHDDGNVIVGPWGAA